MKIKKFTASSMREALLQIKEQLGEDAVILKTRKIPKNMFSLGSKDEIEVTAGIDEDAVNSEKMPPLKMNGNATGVYQRPRSSNIIDTNQSGAPEVRPWTPPVKENKKNKDLKEKSQPPLIVPDSTKDKQQIEELKENIQELKILVKNIMENNSSAANLSDALSGAWVGIYKKLLDAEVKPDIAGSVLKKISSSDLLISDAMVEKKFISSFNDNFPVTGPLKLKKVGPLVIAFVGPTGSGKTTTLAKIAAHCCLNKNKKVSIITADTYRIAAIEQIRMFADIIKVGLQVVFSPMEITDAMKNCSGDDLVLVDTAGRCQRNEEHMDDLKEMLTALSPDEIHLVISATTKDSDLSDIVKRYRSLKINRLLFTKLDETIKLGNIFNIVNESSIPVSYFTFGQSVPDDIELAQPSRYVQRLWGVVKSE
ncbi:MAG TPA: flagellar biosynthesis protein FlhF [Chitinispirillaceae bacterium]|nr:flagellar biosynthesis protein FlhF [Chitinispirillaceae bacterium]